MNTRKPGKALIFSAPSGSGKSTIISSLLRRGLNLAFSVSATSRPPRGSERDGADYFFLTPAEFRRKIAGGEFLEYAEVYPGCFYGTLKAQAESLLARGRNVVFDVDVLGARSIKEAYGPRALSVFIRPPSAEALRRRLESRATDSPAMISERVRRAEFELGFAADFDRVIVNDDLQTAEDEAFAVVSGFLGS